MKCVRDTGMGIHFNTWRAICSEAQRDMRKNRQYDYDYLNMTLPRYRARKRVLLALRRSEDTVLYWRTRYRLCCKYNKNAWRCR